MKILKVQFHRILVLQLSLLLGAQSALANRSYEKLCTVREDPSLRSVKYLNQMACCSTLAMQFYEENKKIEDDASGMIGFGNPAVLRDIERLKLSEQDSLETYKKDYLKKAGRPWVLDPAVCKYDEYSDYPQKAKPLEKEICSAVYGADDLQASLTREEKIGKLTNSMNPIVYKIARQLAKSKNYVLKGRELFKKVTGNEFETSKLCPKR